ncbi:MAG: hypothetical protein Q8R47_01875 [Nanoarchaeota archaeon]|nr:hypothetical protein [Nanoarchaeota archaeon]
MSWLQKAVLFLKNGTQTSQEELSISQIQEWLQQRSQEIVEQHHLLPAVKEHAKILEDRRWALEVQLDLWQKRSRLHPSAQDVIPLLRETRQMLDLLHFPDQPAIGEVLAVNQELEKRLYLLIEKIESRSFLHDFSFILEKHEQANTNPLLSVLLDLDATRKKLDNRISESKYHALQVIGSKAEYLRRIHAHLQQLRQEVETKNKRLAAAQHKKGEKEKSLQQLRGDKKNLDLDELTKRKKELGQRIEEKEMEILSFFSKIKPLLQQYQEREPSNGLLFSYLQDPLSSFHQDEGLFVLDLLEKVAESLRQGTFYLHQESMLSSISALEGIYNQRLRSVKDEYQELQKELREITEQVQHNFFVIKVDDAAYRLDHYHKLVKKLDAEISLLNEKATKLQKALAREQGELQSLINSSLGRNVLVMVEQKN